MNIVDKVQQHALAVLRPRLAGALLLAYLGSACGAGAQALTLEQAIRTTWEKSPQLKAQRALAGVYSGDRWRRFLPQEPQLQYSGDLKNATTPVWGASITYPLPFKSLAYTRLDAATARQQRAEWTAQKYDLAVLIAQSYMNGATAQASLEFQRENVQDLETITDAIRLQYTHGHSNQTQKISAELQLTQAQRDLKAAQDQWGTAVALYAKLMNIPPDRAVSFELPDDVPDSIIRDLGSLTSSQLRDTAAVDLGAANHSVAWWSQVPDPSFSVATDNSYTIGLTVPILFPFREAAEARRGRNQATVDKETAKLQLVQDNSNQEAGALDYRRSKVRFLQLKDRDLLLAETMRESAVEAYKRGRLAFADLMLARQTYASLKTEDIQIRAEVVNSHLAGLRDLVETAGDPTPSPAAARVQTTPGVASTPTVGETQEPTVKATPADLNTTDPDAKGTPVEADPGEPASRSFVPAPSPTAGPEDVNGTVGTK